MFPAVRPSCTTATCTQGSTKENKAELKTAVYHTIALPSSCVEDHFTKQPENANTLGTILMAINAHMISKGFICKLDKLMQHIFFKGVKTCQ